MKYTRTALGLLTRQYRSVLKKCLLINLGLFMSAAPANAATTVTTYDALLAALNASSTADVILNRNGSGITITGDGFEISANQKVALKNIGTAGSSSWTNGSGTDYEHRIPSNMFVWNVGGTLSMDNVIIDNPYISFNDDGNTSVGIIRNKGGHVKGITNTSITNAYITTYDPGFGPFGGVILNYNGGTVDLIQNVTIKNITVAPKSNAPHGGAIENTGYTSLIKKIDNVTIENVTLITHNAINDDDKNRGGGGNHGVLENQTAAGMGDISNLTMKNNFLYRPGNYVPGDYANNHASAAGLYNLGGINSITDSIFQGNHTKTEWNKANASDGALLNLSMGTNDQTSTRRGRIEKIDNVQFIGNYTESAASSSGGAMGSGVNRNGYSYLFTPYIGEMTNVTFEGNYAHGYADAVAGALSNTGYIGKISGEFTRNYAKSDTSYAYGGALKNSGIQLEDGLTISSTIGEIIADFTENYTLAMQDAYGGAIYNVSGVNGITAITSVTAKQNGFTGNYTKSTGVGYYAAGGAIYGSRSTIENINANFSANYAEAKGRAAGGAINVNRDAAINTITGNFSNNYAKSVGTGLGEGDKTYARGGAIFNVGYIKKISGNFTQNSAQSAGIEAYGGAVYQMYSDAYSLGIDEISGTFQGNYALATNSAGLAKGGAIYNGENMQITVTGSNFIDNYAQAGSSALGGAIYNVGNITFSGTNTFSNNYQQVGSTKTFNDIYNEGTITVSANGTLTINDGITGDNGAVTLNSSSKINLNAVLSGNIITLNRAGIIYGSYTPTGGSKTYGNMNILALTVGSAAGSALNSANSYIANSTLGTVNLSSDLNYTLDINAANKTADKLIVSGVAPGSSGKVSINSFNVLGSTSFADITDKNFKVQILQAPNANIQLALSSTATSQLGNERVVETQSTSYTDAMKADNTWGDVYQTHTTTTTTYGKLGLATTTTTNDSIGMNVTRTTTDTSHTSLGDTLVLVNADTTFTDKTFSATSANPNYTLSSNLTATKGNLTINGTGKSTSTLNLNGKTGFNIGSGASLSLNNLTLSGGSGSTVTNSNRLDVSNSTIANSITLNNNANLNLNGNNTVNTAISGTNGTITVSNDSNTFNAKATQKNLTINAGGKLIASADNLAITNTITNNGTLQLIGGTLSQSVGGSGQTGLTGNTTLASGKAISTNGLNLGTSTLTVNNTANGAINVSSFGNTGASGLNLANNATQTATLGTVNLAGNLNYTLDINAANKTADKLIVSGVAPGSSGKVSINSFNVLGSTSFADITDKNFKVQILQAPNANIQLALSSTATSQLGNERVVETQSTSYTDAMKADNTWGDVYQTHTTTTTTYGKLGLATTTTTNDSIGMNVTRTTTDTSHTSLGDTLVLVNADTTFTDKTFSATSANPNYTLSSNLTATKGNLTINGTGKSTSTLNLNGKTGFNIGSGASLSLNNLTLSGGSGSTVTNSNRLDVSNSTIANSITLNNNANLNLNGNNTVNTAISGTNGTITVSNDSNTFNAKATQKNLTINAGGKLIASADNLAITNTITNNGTLQLIGGTLSQSVGGSGQTGLTGNTTLASGKAISTNGLNLGTSTLTVNNTANGAINVSSFGNTGASGLNLANNATQTATLGTVNLAGNLNYTLDINAANKTADKLIVSGVAPGSSGKVSINSFNVLGSTSFADITDKNFKVQILQAPNANIQLALSSTATSQLGNERVVETTTEIEKDSIKATTLWGDIYQTHTTVTDTYGKLGLATTSTANDSIGMNVTRQSSTTTHEKTDDTLRLVAADDTNTDKTFTATEDNPNYTVEGSNAGLTTVNHLNITGLNKNQSTLNLGNRSFILASNAQLDLNNLTAIASSGTLVQGTGTLNANSVDINGDIMLSGDNYHVNLANTTLNGYIDLSYNGNDNAETLNLRNTTVNGDITISTNNQTVDMGDTVNLNGVISSADNKKINVVIDNAGVKMQENTFAQADLLTAQSTFHLNNDTIETYTVKSLNDNIYALAPSIYNIDIDIAARTSDKIKIMENSAATVTIGRIYTLNGTFDDLPTVMTGNEFKVQILDAPDDNVKLQLSVYAKQQISRREYEINRITYNRDDVVVSDVNWNDVFYHKTQDEVFYGRMGLVKTQTEDDSIGIVPTESRMDEIVVHEPLGDTLKLLNTNTEYTEKSFTTDDAAARYTVSEDLGQTYGSLLITGQKDATNTSTIDFAGYNGFDIAENASVTAQNVIFTNSGDSSEITVQKSGTMTLDDASINNVSLALDGTLNLNNNQVSLKNAVFGSDSEISLRINTLSDFGKLTADSVRFNDKALLKVSLADKLVGFNQTANILLLQATDGDFEMLQETYDNDAYSFQKKNNNGWYTIKLAKTAQDVVRENNGSKNNEATAAAWVDQTNPTEYELSDKLNKQAQNNPATFIDSLTALAPNDAPIIQTVEADNGGLMDEINMHLRGSHDAIAPLGTASQYGGQPTQYRGQPIQYRNMPRPKPRYRPDYYNTGYTYGLSSGDLINPAALWLNAYKGKSKFKEHDKVKGFDTDRTGFSAAVEKNFNYFKIGAGYAYETDKVDAFKRDVDVDMHRAFAYMQYQPNNIFINGAIAYGTASYKESKEVVGQKYGTSYDTTTFSAQTTLGYEIDYITPEVGMRYYHISRDEYTDEAKQKVDANDMNILRGVAGVRMGADIGNKYQYTLRPELYGGVSYDMVSDSDDAVVTLPNGVTYNVDGETPDKLGIELGGGITAEFAERLSLNAQYIGSFRKNYTSHTGMLGMRLKF